ncbi:MAG: ABC transporter ATP-binding protein [Sedimentisphaerales bacterium]|nr:ABC transporter ATP-binding protein [Sedimentisphaerales bacterium]
MAETDTLVRLIDVDKRYPAPPGAETPPALQQINWQVSAGESAAIVGPSGSGKSTLLNLIGGLDTATSGRVLLDGEDLGRLGEKRLARIRNRKIGFVFQLHHLLPQCTVWENVLLPTLVLDRQRSDRQFEDRAAGLLERVGLADRIGYRPGQLSGGERQRAAVVRALINRPKLILADEPTGSLDRQAAQTLADLLVELNREEAVTLIVVTHSLDLARRMTGVWRLRDGRLQAGGDGA